MWFLAELELNADLFSVKGTYLGWETRLVQ